MTDDERTGFRALLDATMRFVQDGETYEAELLKQPSSEVRNALLTSTRKHLTVLRQQTEDLERLIMSQDKT
jgi:hypothetical protein